MNSLGFFSRIVFTLLTLWLRVQQGVWIRKPFRTLVFPVSVVHSVIIAALLTCLFLPIAELRAQKFVDPLPKVQLSGETLNELNEYMRRSENLLATHILPEDYQWELRNYLSVIKVRLKEENLTEKEAEEAMAFSTAIVAKILNLILSRRAEMYALEEVTTSEGLDSVHSIEMNNDVSFNYFVSDGDAWYREKETPYNLITPEPKTNILAQGLQIAVLEVMKDEKEKEVAKMKLKGTGEIEYTSLSNLTQVKSFSEDRKYKFIKDYSALKIPFSGNSANKNYKKDAKITADKYFGNYVKIKGEGGEVEGHWIDKSALIWTELIGKEDFLDETESATKVGTKFTGNETSVACNICVRSALFILKEDPALFSKEGSAFYDPANAFNVSYQEGYITNPGRAKNIKEDFDVITTKADLNSRFTEIERKDDEGWEAYFKRLQDKADLGGIVIGMMLNSSGSSGHIMMITPGGMVNIKKENQADFEPTWGASFTRVKINKVPKVLECGKGVRENDAPLCRNVDRNGAQLRLKWFEYKN